MKRILALALMLFSAMVVTVVSQQAAPGQTQQAPDVNAYYQLGPDSISHDGVPKGEVRGPSCCPARPIQAPSTPTGSTFPHSTIARFPRAL